MERKIGEIFEHNREWYQCVNTGFSCADCDIKGGCSDEHIGACSGSLRTDGKAVHFKKLEKVGEPYIVENSVVSRRPFQKYRLYEQYFTLNEKNLLFTSYGNIVSIEIKQNKEDMEENKLNLKPFDIQKAREGKPVCTRDGRKARIICFDLKNDEYPIVAAVENDSSETLFSYTTNGEIADGIESDKDLMMLIEKRSGWAKVRKDINLYDTKEEADRKMIGNDEYVTAKVFWEE